MIEGRVGVLGNIGRTREPYGICVTEISTPRNGSLSVSAGLFRYL